MGEENVVTAPNDGNAQNVAQPKLRSATLKSTTFSSNVGVRQVENLSPALFLIFLNDLSEFISHACDGLTNVGDMAKIL